MLSGPVSSRGVAAGPVPVGVKPASAVSTIRSRCMPSSRIQTCTVCSPALGTAMVAFTQRQAPLVTVTFCAVAAPSRPACSVLPLAMPYMRSQSWCVPALGKTTR